VLREGGEFVKGTGERGEGGKGGGERETKRRNETRDIEQEGGGDSGVHRALSFAHRTHC
jgi:hypothetical protein